MKKTIKILMIFSVSVLTTKMWAQIRPTIQKEIRLVNPAQSGTGYLALRAAEGTATYTITLPAKIGRAHV